VREGLKYLQAGNVERATRQFERAVQLAPADPFVYIPLARAHGAARRFAEAHKVLAKAEIHSHGERKIVYEIELTRGDLLRDEGNREAARAAYVRAAGLRFFNREARERLRTLDAQGNMGEGSD
jgi:tetratricopeptide (TPR) repeat protein